MSLHPKHALALSLLSSVTILHAQNMNSPYSVYGVGDIDGRDHNRTSGMANTGLAIKSGQYIISNNPASLTGLTRSVFHFNTAFSGKFVTYSGDAINSTNRTNRDFGIERLALGIKINSFWGSSIGFRKFSRANYKLNGTKTVEGSTEVYNAQYDGHGGLNDFYWTNSFAIGKHLSLGVKASMISGSINQTEIVETADHTITTEVQDYLSNGRLEYGAIYSTAVNKRWDASLGGRISKQTRLSAERTLTVTEGSTEIIKDAFLKNDRFYLPDAYALGASLQNKKGTTFAADYSFEDWSALQVNAPGWSLVSANRLSVGAEFSKYTNAWNRQVERSFVQFGAFVNNSYLRIRGNQIKEYGVTAGIGRQLKNNLALSVSVEAGSRGTTKSSLIKEGYFQFTFNFSYRELIQSAGRKYD